MYQAYNSIGVPENSSALEHTQTEPTNNNKSCTKMPLELGIVVVKMDFCCPLLGNSI